MSLPTSHRALGALGAVFAGGVVVASAIYMHLGGGETSEWVPWAVFGALFPTLYLAPASMNTLRPNLSVGVKRVVMVAMFGLWFVAGGVLFLTGFRDYIVYLIVAIGIVGVFVIAIRSPTEATTA